MEASADVRRGRVARWTFVLTIIVIPLLLFGVFEGFYNHLVKDALYFSGMSVEQLRRFFPPPMYEMPNDAFFELTGVLQIVPAVSVAFSLYRMLRRSRLHGPSLSAGAR
jgi:hypothetical protein